MDGQRVRQRTARTLSTIAGAAAGTAVAGEEEEDKIIGGVVGGVLGGVAGRALTPQQAEVVRDVARRMCKTLPYRFGTKR